MLLGDKTAHNISFTQYGRQNMPSTIGILTERQNPALAF
jgi:hypothetical protein